MNRRIGLISLVAVLAGAAGCQKEPAATAPAAEPGAAATSPAEDGAAGVVLCEHSVPGDLCTRCNPDLAAVFKDMGDWCGEHGVPESQCLKCNPGLTFTATAEPKDWCKEHGLPESKCTKCNPQLVAQYVEAGDYCREHGFPESVCPVCNPELAKAGGTEVAFPPPGMKVRLASAATVADVGIETHRAQSRSFSRDLEVVGKVTFNQNRHVQLSSRGEARVLEVLVDLGDDVKQGQPLVRLASSVVGADQAQLAAAQARIEAAQAKLHRETQLAEKGISPQRDVEEARRELAAARAEHDTARSALAATGAAASEASGRYTIVAPFAGTVVARSAVPGMTVASGELLVEVADISTMWALLDLPEAEAPAVRPGQTVALSFEGMRMASLAGKISRVSASVDPHSRTVRARVELPNPERDLKAGAFLRANVVVAARHEALMVPIRSVQRAENRALVFVKMDEAVFEPVAVELGAADGDFVEILEGLEPGAEVVTTGAFLLKTEILKDSIGAGCCETGEE